MKWYGDREIAYPQVGADFGYWKFKEPGVGYTWVMLCICGTERVVRSQDVRMKASVSCGCASRSGSKGATGTGLKNKTHGTDYGDKVYRTWRSAKNRCFNPKSDRYERYGAAGITMHKPWADSFELFRDYIGLPPTPRHSLDRINNNLGYVPGNVRWATLLEQARNRRDTLKAEYLGVVKPLTVWAEVYNLAASTLKCRLALGWPIEKALTTKVRLNK